MERIPQNEKDSGVNRVMGFESEKETDFLQYFKHKFETNSFGPEEKEKTTEQRELIERINNEMVDFLSQYGVEAIKISADNVHILDKSKFTEDELKKIEQKFGTENGFYSALKQGIAIMKDPDVSKLSFWQTVVHEMLHMQAFYSYQKSDKEAADLTLKNGEDESADMNIRRSGFSIGTQDGKRLLFHKLNESVITELEIRFEKKYMTKWIELEAELEARDEYVQQVAERDKVSLDMVKQIVAGIKGDKISGYKWVSYPYDNERQRFNSLIGELYEKNKSEFSSREDVFNLFATATITGRLLPVARLIEDTFGKGSFRKLGEMTADHPKTDSK